MRYPLVDRFAVAIRARYDRFMVEVVGRRSRAGRMIERVLSSGVGDAGVLAALLLLYRPRGKHIGTSWNLSVISAVGQLGTVTLTGETEPINGRRTGRILWHAKPHNQKRLSRDGFDHCVCYCKGGCR